MQYLSRYLTGKIEVKSAEEARQQAIDWQQWQSEQSLSYSEVADYADYFRKLGKKYNLTAEFKEEAII